MTNIASNLVLILLIIYTKYFFIAGVPYSPKYSCQTIFFCNFKSSILQKETF